jgi:hypothetical protein
MKLSRREAIRVSGTAVAGLSMGVSRSNDIVAQTVRQQEWPDHLVEGDLRQRADLPLNPDGSAPEYPPEAADEITDWVEPCALVIWKAFPEGHILPCFSAELLSPLVL